MKFPFSKPCIVYDLETTDTEPNECAIFEMGIIVVAMDGTTKETSMRFKPWKPISPGAEEVTGVTNAMVEGCPPFSNYAEKIWKAFQGKDILGYNVRRFDLVCLDAELRRASNNRLKLNLTDTVVIDALGIFMNKEPRTLSAAVEKYCGRKHEDAHGAAADAKASLDVFLSMLQSYPDLDTPLAVATASRIGDRQPADLAGKLYRDENADLRFNFGKNKDRLVSEYRSYAEWMVGASFPGSTCDLLNDFLKGVRK